mgnify:FL=1
MSDTAEQARTERPVVVIIGAGIVGASLADELTARGLTDVTVLDKGPFPRSGGSTTHAPGMVFQVHQVPVMAQMARHTVAVLSELADEQGPLWTRTGSLELAESEEWQAVLERRQRYALEAGLPMEILTPEECARLQPLVDPSAFRMGIHNPADGVTHAVRVVAARLGAAQQRGARVHAEHEVTGLTLENGRVRGVQTGRRGFPPGIVLVAGMTATIEIDTSAATRGK